MANRNKAKGTVWESQIRDYLNKTLGLLDEHGKIKDPYSAMNVRRPAQEGAHDVGDVHAVPFCIEAKNVKSRAVPTWLRQAHVEAAHAGFPYGVAVEKRHRVSVRVGLVHFSVHTWTRVRRALGLTSRQMWERYRFAGSLRGLDTGRWYFTHHVEDFARLLDDIRARHGEGEKCEVC